ncbi:uncharacterized protein LOC110725903 [Chenopodium quinoa]|uniref:uncharacterized protein LOC110725903 n=1 Tax=Chenopodium quinoa TaxID=63459 RepID=UPI000B78AA23|nr:uncharacterized protein LOC110725903 [Chenopodium quinoa]
MGLSYTSSNFVRYTLMIPDNLTVFLQKSPSQKCVVTSNREIPSLLQQQLKTLEFEHSRNSSNYDAHVQETRLKLKIASAYISAWSTQAIRWSSEAFIRMKP